LCFPPNTTAILQPLDVGIFAVFKYFSRILRLLASRTSEGVTAHNIIRVISPALEEALKFSTVVNSFAKPGINCDLVRRVKLNLPLHSISDDEFDSGKSIMRGSRPTTREARLKDVGKLVHAMVRKEALPIRNGEQTAISAPAALVDLSSMSASGLADIAAAAPIAIAQSAHANPISPAASMSLVPFDAAPLSARPGAAHKAIAEYTHNGPLLQLPFIPARTKPRSFAGVLIKFDTTRGTLLTSDEMAKNVKAAQDAKAAEAEAKRAKEQRKAKQKQANADAKRQKQQKAIERKQAAAAAKLAKARKRDQQAQARLDKQQQRKKQAAAKPGEDATDSTLSSSSSSSSSSAAVPEPAADSKLAASFASSASSSSAAPSSAAEPREGKRSSLHRRARVNKSLEEPDIADDEEQEGSAFDRAASAAAAAGDAEASASDDSSDEEEDRGDDASDSDSESCQLLFAKSDMLAVRAAAADNLGQRFYVCRARESLRIDDGESLDGRQLKVRWFAPSENKEFGKYREVHGSTGLANVFVSTIIVTRGFFLTDGNLIPAATAAVIRDWLADPARDAEMAPAQSSSSSAAAASADSSSPMADEDDVPIAQLVQRKAKPSKSAARSDADGESDVEMSDGAAEQQRETRASAKGKQKGGKKRKNDGDGASAQSLGRETRSSKRARAKK